VSPLVCALWSTKSLYKVSKGDLVPVDFSVVLWMPCVPPSLLSLYYGQPKCTLLTYYTCKGEPLVSVGFYVTLWPQYSSKGDALVCVDFHVTVWVLVVPG